MNNFPYALYKVSDRQFTYYRSNTSGEGCVLPIGSTFAAIEHARFWLSALLFNYLSTPKQLLTMQLFQEDHTCQ